MKFIFIFFIFFLPNLAEKKYWTKETEDFVNVVTVNGLRYHLFEDFKATKECYQKIKQKYEEDTSTYTKKMKEAIIFFDEKYYYENHYVEFLNNASSQLHSIGEKLSEYQHQLKLCFDKNDEEKAKKLTKKNKRTLGNFYNLFILLRENIKIRPHSAYNEYNSRVSAIRDELLDGARSCSEEFKSCVTKLIHDNKI